MKNPYEVLGVPTSAGDTLIKRAYRRKSFAHHPDTGDGNIEAYREVQEAYDILSSPERRKRYNAVINLLKTEEENKRLREEQKEIDLDPLINSGSGWNIPYGLPVQRFGYKATVNPAATLTTRIDDVIRYGLGGLVAGDTIYVGLTQGVTSSGSYFNSGWAVSKNPTTTTNLKGVIKHVSYGIAPGIPVYGDFVIEVQQ